MAIERTDTLVIGGGQAGLAMSEHLGNRGVPHLVQHGVSALLADPESPEALAEAVRQLADDEALRARLVAGGETLVANFTWERVRDRWLRAYTNARGLD